MQRDKSWPERLSRIRERTLQLAGGMWRPLYLLSWYSGGVFVWRKFAGEPENSKKAPSGVLWLLGMHFAAFGISERLWNAELKQAESYTLTCLGGGAYSYNGVSGMRRPPKLLDPAVVLELVNPDIAYLYLEKNSDKPMTNLEIRCHTPLLFHRAEGELLDLQCMANSCKRIES